MTEHELQSSILICAKAETVFRFFTDSALFAKWWGDGSTIDGRVGGAVTIRYPNGVVASGEVRELIPHRRVVFTFGYEGENQPLKPGSTTVEIDLKAGASGTLVMLTHKGLPSEAVRDMHVQGWRYQLALFSGAASQAQHEGLADVCDRLFAAWNEPDEKRRARLLEQCVSEDVSFMDAHGVVTGRKALSDHIAAALRFMPGHALSRNGQPQVVHGFARVNWKIEGPRAASGVNFLDLAPDGRISRIVGFWGA